MNTVLPTCELHICGFNQPQIEILVESEGGMTCKYEGQLNYFKTSLIQEEGVQCWLPWYATMLLNDPNYEMEKP